MSKNKIRQLIAKYEAEREYYLSSGYNETQLRIDFLDPFFEALGWDINNTKQKPTYEREVILEESLRNEESINSKKPDYTFRQFWERKFFVEAKKPSVKIDQVNDPAKQVRRYWFTAKLKISVLSNFEYLAIYDCSQKVGETDTCNNSRVKIYHYLEYADAFEDLQRELGFESVQSGVFDENWQHIEEQLKLFSVDQLFLSQINEWRLLLGIEIFSHNPSYSEDLLNDIVQKYLNSIIFLRVCEDRNLEEYKTLLNIANGADYTKLITRFRDADRKYNSWLFNHPLTSDIITNNHSAFWRIIKQLYYPESTYSFSVFSSDILGNIYEIFLSEQLRIVNWNVVLVRKPEHIDRDVITTPNFIVKNILSQTVLEYCNWKTDTEILSYTFADIACGSWVFLLETYQLLNDLLIDYYLVHNRANLIQIWPNSYKLPFSVKRNILESCLFWVDKDFSAVEACKFWLLLKLLEDENATNIPNHALPDLVTTINHWNSLIKPGLTSPSNREAINPFSFWARKFDVIIGNPPYMTTDEMKKLTSLEYPIYKNEFSSAYKQFDKYFLFIEMALSLLKEGWFFGYIVPSKFTKVWSWEKLRGLLKAKKCINRFISFWANQVFLDKTTYTCILILRKTEQDNFEYIEVKSLKDWKNQWNEVINHIALTELDNEVWALIPDSLKDIYSEINRQSVLLWELLWNDDIFNGIQTSANSIYIHTPTREDAEYFYFSKDEKEYKIEKPLVRPYFKTNDGDDNLNTYRTLKPNAIVVYPYKLNSSWVLEFVNINELRLEYPFAYKYLSDYKVKLSTGRDIKPEPTTNDEWYRYWRHQSLESCEVPAKIIVWVLSQWNKYAIDYNKTLISSGGTAGYCMITLPAGLKYSIHYIQALLNSKYLEWYSSIFWEIFRWWYIARGTKVLKRLPIRKINFDNLREKDLHDSISSIQKDLIDLQEQIDRTTGNSRQQDPLKRLFVEKKNELDLLLFTLYWLGANDAKIPLITENLWS